MEIIQLRQDNRPVPFRSQLAHIEDAIIVEEVKKEVNTQLHEQLKVSNRRSPFIEANTKQITLPELRKDFIPVFSKDNESSISHTEFVEAVYAAVSTVFPRESLSSVECRVSHEVCGRIPSAVGKPTTQLEDWEKTRYFERLAFNIQVTSIYDAINGNELTLSITGVRAYNHTNLYGKKGVETFKLAIGFLNHVCTNMCINSDDGLASEIKVMSVRDLQMKALDLFQNYNIQQHLNRMKQLPEMNITESQFATLLGRTRLYQYLPTQQKKELPLLTFGDSHLNTIAKDYYKDNRFCKCEDGNLNLWNLYNLFTNANRSSSYIDLFIDRGANATDFVSGIASALNGDSNYKWFIQ
ncbi:MAG: DUF3871 family protein [Dysgonomonas sp.]